MNSFSPCLITDTLSSSPYNFCAINDENNTIINNEIGRKVVPYLANEKNVLYIDKIKKFKICLATSMDIPFLCEKGNKELTCRNHPNYIQDVFKYYHDAFLVAKTLTGDRIIGSVLAINFSDKKISTISMLWVDRHFQKAGIGKQLIKTLRTIVAMDQILYCYSYEAMIDTYRKFGLHPIDRICMYSNPYMSIQRLQHLIKRLNKFWIINMPDTFQKTIDPKHKWFCEPPLWDKLIEYDTIVHLCDRHKFLHSLLRTHERTYTIALFQSNNNTFSPQNSNEISCIAYGVLRPTINVGYTLGPLYANKPEYAAHILSQICKIIIKSIVTSNKTLNSPCLLTFSAYRENNIDNKIFARSNLINQILQCLGLTEDFAYRLGSQPLELPKEQIYFLTGSSFIV